MKALYKILFLSLFLSLTGCGKNEKEVAVGDTKAISVTVSTLASNDENSPFVVSGTIQAANSANLSTRLMGYVEKIHVNIGDNVSRGQRLLTINNTDIKAKLAQVNAGITQAEAAFINAEKDFNRFNNLFDQNSASQKELDDITANYNMAKARLEAAKQMKNEVNAQFAYTNVKAPFTGIITAKHIDEGALANPGMPLLAIESPGNFEVSARIPEEIISQIKEQMEVNVSVASINASLKGTLTEISASSAQTGGQYLVVITINDNNDQLRSGMFASVELPVVKTDLAQVDNTIFIPKEALITNGQLSGVYTVSQQQTAVLRWLRLGKTIDDKVEVLSGLSAGETIIIGAEGKLYNGSKLNIQ